MEAIKLKVKELRDVVCPTCEGKGGWRECHGDLIWEGDCGLSEDVDCPRCDKTGELEVEITHCEKCGAELPWDDDDAQFDEDTETFWLCPNECDRQRKPKTEVEPQPITEIPF